MCLGVGHPTNNFALLSIEKIVRNYCLMRELYTEINPTLFSQLFLWNPISFFSQLQICNGSFLFPFVFMLWDFD